MTQRVIRVPVINEGVLLSPPHGLSREPVVLDGRAGKVFDVAATDLLFDLEGFEAEAEAVDLVTDSASRTRQTIARLLSATDPADEAVYSAAAMAVQASGGSLEATAQMLARQGYTVRLHTSAGGTLHRLKHTYITATRNMVINGEPAEWVIDPSFAQAFAITSPTPRYAHILTAVPPVLVAPLPRLVRALLLLGAELARCFEKQQLPLPPWRHADAMATKYDGATSVLVHSSGEAAAAATAAVPAGAPRAAAARKQQRQRQQLERVHLRLARLGLLQEHGLPASPASSASSGSSPTADGTAAAALDSPRSVLEASASSRFVGFDAKADECVCCGWQQTQLRAARQQQQHRRHSRQPSLLGGRLQQTGVAAAAA